MFVEVAFTLPFNQTFTYKWPEEYVEDAIGYRVLVPFQKRLLTGYVLEQSETSKHETVKNVQDVLDEIPVLTKELISLIRFVSDRYGVTLGEAVQTVVPAGLLQQTKKKIIASDKVGSPEDLQEKKLLETVRIKKVVDWSAWKKRNPQSTSMLRNLHKNGWIEFQTIFQRQRASEPQESFYSKSTDEEIKLKGKKQRQVFDTIRDQKEMSLTALKEIFGADVTSALRVLEKKGIVSKRISKRSQDLEKLPTSKALTLTSHQDKIVREIESAIVDRRQLSILLHGVTGSGKTEVYLQAAQKCLDAGRSVLALVPEISLTPQFLSRFQNRFGSQIALLHSQRSETERVLEWKRILEGKARIVVGTRSSVFSPLQNIGLVILDEEHDRSYKQEDQVMYHAKEIAKLRSEKDQAVLLLGSATPSIETYFQTEQKLIGKEILSDRIHQLEMPEVEIVNLQDEENFGQDTIFSVRLRDAIQKTLQDRKQIILFLNRRGFSTQVYCPKCGTTLQCPNCAISMTYHRDVNSFVCHYCDLCVNTDHPCPTCIHSKWIKFGFGTEKVEKELKFLFPDAIVDRLDRDTIKKGVFDTAFTNFADRKTDILIGTQMITKGLDFEHVDLVGVLLADQSLHFPDFRASEQTFQLLTQVIGRAGRGSQRGLAILQTLQPKHYAIVSAAKQNYQEFYEQEIRYRETSAYPPYSKLILFEIRGRDKKTVDQMSSWLKKQIESVKSEKTTFKIFGPSPAPIEKINSNFRVHLLIKFLGDSNVEKMMKWIYVNSKEEFAKRDLFIKFNMDPFDFM